MSGVRRLDKSLWPGSRPAFPVHYDPNLTLAKRLKVVDCPQARLIDAKGKVVWGAGGAAVKPEALAQDAANRVRTDRIRPKEGGR